MTTPEAVPSSPAAATMPPPRRPATVPLLLRQVRAQNRIFWRTPAAAVFTLVLPVVMLVLFVALFGNDDLEFLDSGPVKTAQFYAPGLAVFAAASATYTNLGINLSARREDGILKRVRGTPLPPWMYLGGAVLSAVWLALVASVIMIGLGVVFYDINVEAAKVPAMFVTFLAGSTTFAILGVALASVAKSAASAPAIANATIIPLAFVSNVFISFGSDEQSWLQTVGDIFPLKPFAVSFQESMSPFSEVPAIEWDQLAVLAVWAVLGALVAWRKFRWDPVLGTSTSRGRRSRRRR